MSLIRVTKLEENAVLPTRKHLTDAGMDFYSLEHYTVYPRTYKILRTGIAVELPQGYFMLLKPKSKNNHLIGGGVVDQEFMGEILFKVFNPTDNIIHFRLGSPVGQGVIIPLVTPEVVEVSVQEFNKKETIRGTSGGINTQLAEENDGTN